MKKLLTAAAGEGDMVDEAESETTKILLLDLALSLMPALDTANAEFLYKSAIPFVADASGGVQKRAYKLLQLMSQVRQLWHCVRARVQSHVPDEACCVQRVACVRGLHFQDVTALCAKRACVEGRR